jgi:hypothetical protein
MFPDFPKKKEGAWNWAMLWTACVGTLGVFIGVLCWWSLSIAVVGNCSYSSLCVAGESLYIMFCMLSTKWVPFSQRMSPHLPLLASHVSFRFCKCIRWSCEVIEPIPWLVVWSGDDGACALFSFWRCRFWRTWTLGVVLVMDILLLLELEYRSGAFIFLVFFSFLAACICTAVMVLCCCRGWV